MQFKEQQFSRNNCQKDTQELQLMEYQMIIEKVQIHSKNKEVIITQKVIQMDPTANQNCRKLNWTKNLNRRRITHSIRIVLKIFVTY